MYDIIKYTMIILYGITLFLFCFDSFLFPLDPRYIKEKKISFNTFIAVYKRSTRKKKRQYCWRLKIDKAIYENHNTGETIIYKFQHKDKKQYQKFRADMKENYELNLFSRKIIHKK